MVEDLHEHGYGSVEGTSILDKSKVFQYIEEAKPAVVVMHHAGETNDMVKTSMLVIDMEAVDNHPGLQHIVMGHVGDDARMEAVHQEFVRRTLEGLRAHTDRETLYYQLLELLGYKRGDGDKAGNPVKPVRKDLN